LRLVTRTGTPSRPGAASGSRQGWHAGAQRARRSGRQHQAGAKDKGKRKRSGYVKSWEEGGARREAAGHR